MLFLAVSVLNTHESKRFKKGAFRFWGCMPIYDQSAARANGVSQSWIVRRTNEVHHIAMGHVVDQIRKLCVQRPYRFGDGLTRKGVARLAFFLGDQPGQDKHLAKTTKGCGMCHCPADKLDSTEETFPPRDSRALLRFM